MAKSDNININNISGSNRDKRQSNIELARIFAMSMIVIWHFYVHGGVYSNCPSLLFIAPMLVLGVDIFVLISGFFLIKLKPRTLIFLILLILIIEALSLVGYGLAGNPINVLEVYKSFIDPLGNSDYWFIKCYVALVLVSPFLNKALQTLDIKQLRVYLAIFTLFQIYSCFLFHNVINEDGYTLFNFIYLYCLGHYIHRDDAIMKLSAKRLFAILAVLMFINVALAFITTQQYEPLPELIKTRLFNLTMAYNNPCVFIGAAAVMLLFLKLNFCSNLVNRIASYSLGVYLIQDGLFGDVLYKILDTCIVQGQILKWFALCIALYFAYWICSFIITVPVQRISRRLSAKFKNLESIQ